MTATPPPALTQAPHLLSPTAATHQSPEPMVILPSRPMPTADHRGGFPELRGKAPRPRPSQAADDAHHPSTSHQSCEVVTTSRPSTPHGFSLQEPFGREAEPGARADRHCRRSVAVGHKSRRPWRREVVAVLVRPSRPCRSVDDAPLADVSGQRCEVTATLAGGRAGAPAWGVRVARARAGGGRG